MQEKQNNKWALRGRVLWLYIKYQLVSKIIVGLIAFPFFQTLTQFLIEQTGRTNLSSGDYLSFILSLNGLLVVILVFLLLVFILGMDINTFIIISSLVEEDKLDMKIRRILPASFKSLKYFFSPIGVFLVAFIAPVLPLLNIGISLGPLKNFKIPNFITFVIFSNRLYSIGYYALLTLLFILSVLYIFTIHFILIDGKSIRKSLKDSRLLLKKHWKSFIVDYFLQLIKILLICIIMIAILFGILMLLSTIISQFYPNDDALITLLFLSIIELFAFFGFLSVPIMISILTKLFYKYNKEDARDPKLNFETKATKLLHEDAQRKIKVRTKIEVITTIILILLFNFAMAFLFNHFFEDIFQTKVNVQIISHRGGGDLGAENTVEGIEQAIAKNVDWTEIDVQRTKDGEYIINHDPNFSRVSGVDKSPMEMTLAEIKELKVKNEFFPEKESQEVPTFEEILDVSKGKIGVFVELKGKSADKKMVDDVVKLITEKDMLDECIILSLDYDIIKYTASAHPEIKTGFLYFFSVGDLENLEGDYLIMEEREATPEKLEEIHQAGKKAVVWTVNTEESIQKFIHSDVDGIITDYVSLVQESIEESNNRSQLDVILDSLTN